MSTVDVVHAAGDARSGPAKRVDGAVGEGGTAVAFRRRLGRLEGLAAAA